MTALQQKWVCAAAITTINRYGPVRQAAWDVSAAGLD
jgi:hypothetical protein